MFYHFIVFFEVLCLFLMLFLIRVGSNKIMISRSANKMFMLRQLNEFENKFLHSVCFEEHFVCLQERVLKNNKKLNIFRSNKPSKTEIHFQVKSNEGKE